MLRPVTHNSKGFTIVELLVVVVVIAVLAAITVVSYNGIANRAKESSLTSNLASLKKKIELFKVQSSTDRYPGDLNSIDVPNTSAVFRYAANNLVPFGYCLQATDTNLTYFVTQATNPALGTCDENFGLVGWWKFNGNSDNTANPASTTFSSGSPTLAVGQNGQPNTAYSFNGSTTAFSPGSFNTAGISYGAVSISGWVYPPNNPATYQGYFGVNDAGNDPKYYIMQNPGANTLICRIWTTGTGAHVNAGTVSVTPNTWNFVALVYDGTNARCFVNGVGGATTPASGSFLFPNTTFTIGRIGPYYFNGRIDDVRAYSRILSDGEIQDMFTAGAQ